MRRSVGSSGSFPRASAGRCEDVVPQSSAASLVHRHGGKAAESGHKTTSGLLRYDAAATES
jgi:hypothetical protein